MQIDDRMIAQARRVAAALLHEKTSDRRRDASLRVIDPLNSNDLSMTSVVSSFLLAYLISPLSIVRHTVYDRKRLMSVSFDVDPIRFAGDKRRFLTKNTLDERISVIQNSLVSIDKSEMLVPFRFRDFLERISGDEVIINRIWFGCLEIDYLVSECFEIEAFRLGANFWSEICSENSVICLSVGERMIYSRYSSV